MVSLLRSAQCSQRGSSKGSVPEQDVAPSRLGDTVNQELPVAKKRGLFSSG